MIKWEIKVNVVDVTYKKKLCLHKEKVQISYPTQGSGLGVVCVFFPFPIQEDTVELKRGRKEEKENQMHRMEMSSKGKRLVYIIYIYVQRARCLGNDYFYSTPTGTY